MNSVCGLNVKIGWMCDKIKRLIFKNEEYLLRKLWEKYLITLMNSVCGLNMKIGWMCDKIKRPSSSANQLKNN